MYAAGKIPGGFFKREGRPTERAILTARMIDRPIRPLWPKGFTNEVQVICTILSADLVTAARHPRHQRRLGGAHDLAAALPGPGGRRAHRAGRRRARRQPDPDRIEEDAELDLDRRRDEGGPDHGRGGRRRGARGDAARGVRAGAPGDHRSSARRRRSFAGRSASRSGSTPSSPRSSTREHGAADRRGDRGPRPARGCGDGRGDQALARSRAGHELRGGGHRPGVAGALQPRRPARARAARGRGSGPVREQFEERPARTDRGRAGLEAAQVGEAASALRPHRRDRRAAVPGRPGHGRRRGPARQGRAHAPVREEGGRVGLQGPRSPRRSRSRSAVRTAAARKRSARSSARSASRRAPTARRSSRAARRRS